MKLLIFSDTHGTAQPLLDIVQQHAEDAHALLFLGDGERDADVLQEAFPQLPLYRVAGNCDYASHYPSTIVTAFGGLLFFCTHGHEFGVKIGLDSLWQEAKKRGADIALFGHTHAPAYSCTNGVHLFNPGSLTLPRNSKPSYGIITIQNKIPSFETRRAQ